MSRKTMDQYDKPLANTYGPPSTSHPQDDDTRSQALYDGQLNDESAVMVYRKPWDAGHHLANATEDFRDAVWGINEGKRDVRNLKE